MWCVKVAYWWREEPPRNSMDIDVMLFRDKEDAIKRLEDVIRHDWNAYIEEPTGLKSLADLRGKNEPGEDTKYSDWGYDEDGCLAWFEDGIKAYRGEVTEIEIPKEVKR